MSILPSCRRAGVALVALLGLAGCAAPAGMPVPDPTVSAEAAPGEPPEWDGDPRCEAGYGDPHRTLEMEHRVRPLGWPATPDFAVLCILEPVSDVEEIGYYATDPGTKHDDVLWYYEHAFASGTHGYLPTQDSEKILTGVLGGASYFLEFNGFDRYMITWATDGDYADDGS